MTYYANSAEPYTTPMDFLGLLQQGDGRCGTWATLFDETLKVQGITAQNVFGIYDNVPCVASATTDYIATYGNPPSTDGYSVKDVFFVKNWDLSSPNKWNAVDKPGVEGQGNPNPIAIFGDHALVRIGTRIYDPSYGTGPFNSVLDWEDASVDGYGVQFTQTGYLSADFKFWIGKVDTKGLQEVRE